MCTAKARESHPYLVDGHGVVLSLGQHDLLGRGGHGVESEEAPRAARRSDALQGLALERPNLSSRHIEVKSAGKYA